MPINPSFLVPFFPSFGPGFRKAGGRFIRTGLLVLLFSLSPVSKAGAQPPPPGPEAGKRPRVAVLDLTDLGEHRNRTDLAESVRQALSATGRFDVPVYDSLQKRLTGFNYNTQQTCNNPQCAFDIGNMAQSEYVLFGTHTSITGVEAVTLKLLEVQSAKVVWAKVLEIARTGKASSAYQAASAEVAREMLAPKPEVRGKKGEALQPAPKTLVAVIDLSENSAPSRVFFERVGTRIASSEKYELMSPSELTELLNALEINKYSVVPSPENMINLGQKLGVGGVVYSRLYRDGRYFLFRLAMYDVAGKTLVQELPPQPTEDYVKLLDSEKAFFENLVSKEKNQGGKTVKKSGKSNLALWVSLGVLGLGSGMAAFYAGDLFGDKGGSSGPAPSEGCEEISIFGCPPLPPPNP